MRRRRADCAAAPRGRRRADGQERGAAVRGRALRPGRPRAGAHAGAAGAARDRGPGGRLRRHPRAVLRSAPDLPLLRRSRHGLELPLPGRLRLKKYRKCQNLNLILIDDADFNYFYHQFLQYAEPPALNKYNL